MAWRFYACVASSMRGQSGAAQGPEHVETRPNATAQRAHRAPRKHDDMVDKFH